ncbi:Tox-REase-5 domain-containing protein [Streptomyces sp. NBC_00316]|uniref:Tox-REase-5 domain-containing protein n=1 Tax=Streptomyces sp. NBC_00316 TaxID=2975710 RepID=UPI002E2A07D6|nr:Tox-REase-5 domain-containing protein [Streptomyces sp. NBC_00316]
MSAIGGIPVYGGDAPAPGEGRRELPRALRSARVLLHVLFGATLLGGLGLFGSALAVDAMGGVVIGLALYAAVPGVVGWLLSRRVWTGGRGVWGGLIAVQVWLILGGLGNIADGSVHGFTQLFVPTLILVFLTRRESRAWFRLATQERADKPDFSLAHMITWRRDRGQTALEYLGLVLIVVALIGALVLSGAGGQITDRLQAAICSLTGSSCPAAGTGSDTVGAGDDKGGSAAGGSAAGGSAVAGGAGSGGAAGGGSGTGGSDSGGADGGGAASGGTNSSGGSDGGGTSGTGGANGPGGTNGTGGTASGGGIATGGTADGGGTGGPDGPGTDTYPETSTEPEATYDTPVSDADSDDSGDSGNGGDEKEDCGGWGFFGCAWDRTTQVVKGLAVDGVWGDVTGIIDLFKPETWSGLADYGKQLGSTWMQDSKDAGSKWDKGDYFGALGDWGKASFNTVVKVGDDMFVGDEVRDRWNNGEKTRAVTDVVWNVGSLFIPGYDVAKVVGKASKLGKLGKVAAKVAEAAENAGNAARRARKAAEVGDIDGVRKAAKEADEAADEAEDAARKTGCSIALGPRVRYGGTGGISGSGTGVLAAGPPSHVILADDGCDKDAEAKAKEAREQERAAHLEQKRAEEPDRAAKAELAKKQWPEPRRNDTSDPRNYNPPDWAADLKKPDYGSADNGAGYWASRDRNPPPNWKNESWLRYQEQVTGTVRGREYVVPHPKEGKPAVEYDGWDSSRQTFLEAKNGYKGYLSQTEKGSLTASGKNEFVTEARAQVEAAGGKAIEWHFSDPDVAEAAAKAFREEGLPITVVPTKQLPSNSTRKPGAFD